MEVVGWKGLGFRVGGLEHVCWLSGGWVGGRLVGWGLGGGWVGAAGETSAGYKGTALPCHILTQGLPPLRALEGGHTCMCATHCKHAATLHAALCRAQVRVFHDNSGPSPAWFLEEIRIRRAAGAGSSSRSGAEERAATGGLGDSPGPGAGGRGGAGGWTVFPCGRWLALDQDDG